MTANEMKYEFEVLFDKIASFSSPGYTDQEVQLFLTKGQHIFVKEGYNPFNSLDKNARRRREFVELKRNYSTTSQSSLQTGVHPNGYFYDLPTDFMLPLKEEVTISSKDTNGNVTNACIEGIRIPVKPITEDEYNVQKFNPFKKPEAKGFSTDFAWSLEFHQNNNVKRTEIITDGNFTISEYHLRYLKEPVEIIPFTGDGSTSAMQNCELDELAQKEIIDIAVRIASGATVAQEYQIKINEEQLNNQS